jgi:hypothetical protein
MKETKSVRRSQVCHVSPSCRCVVSRVSGALLIVPLVFRVCLVPCLRYSNFNNKTFEMHMLFTDALHREYYICTLNRMNDDV